MFGHIGLTYQQMFIFKVQLYNLMMFFSTFGWLIHILSLRNNAYKRVTFILICLSYPHVYTSENLTKQCKNYIFELTNLFFSLDPIWYTGIYFCFIEIPIDECQSNDNLCSDDCKDTTIGYECVCPVNGTMLDTDQHTCKGKQIINLIYFICVTLNICYCQQSQLNSLQQRCSPSYVWGLTFYWHVENTCLTASFH